MSGRVLHGDAARIHALKAEPAEQRAAAAGVLAQMADRVAWMVPSMAETGGPGFVIHRHDMRLPDGTVVRLSVTAEVREEAAPPPRPVDGKNAG